VMSMRSFAPWGAISRTVAEYIARRVTTSAGHKTPIRRHEEPGVARRRRGANEKPLASFIVGSYCPK
jgi:hypothetical protein